MPHYMDVHNLPPEATLRLLAIAHFRDLETQLKYGVKYTRYWFDPDTRKSFCLVDAPSVDAAVAVHSEAHGFVADKIIPVSEVTVEEMLGAHEFGEKELGLGWNPESPDDPPAVDSAFRTILFTDMEGSTAQTQRLGDDAAMELLRRHNALIRECLASEEGREIKTVGDGFMACFRSVARAVACTIAIQQAFEKHNQDQPDARIGVRIGLSAGEPVAEGEDLFGAAVQLAARACAQAEAGQILVPNVVRELCIGKGFNFGDLGEHALKGFEDPVRVFEVRWQDVA
jgi:class 3 adenylate cyclase